MTHVKVAIVGSGFSGLGTAIALRESGRHDFVILERGDEIGGTWHVNTYPGCACDVPSQVYSFSYELNPEWSHVYARQPEIFAYLLKVTEKYDLRPMVRFGTTVTDARWDSERKLWEIETSTGPLTADFVVAGVGGLSEPSPPDIAGLSTFAGESFHSAEWDNSWSPKGRRIAVIGTGSSAIQFVPQIQPEAEQLLVFQRTASWVLPRRDRDIRPIEKRIYRRFPTAQRVMRSLVYTRTEIPAMSFRSNGRLLKMGEKVSLKMLEKQVPDPVLRAKLTPHFNLGCKRVLLSNHYYPALAADNADVITDRIVQIVPSGIVTEAANGTRTTHEVDTLILGTGFKVQDPPIAHHVLVDGVTLAEHWKKDLGMQALHGLSVAGFPNFFFLMGPNSALGHNSVVLMIEAQIRHLIKALDHLDAGGRSTIEPRYDVQHAQDKKLQRDLQRSVWNAGGCSSWYKNEHGRNTVLWPTFTFTYMRMMDRFDPSEYVIA